MHRMTGLLANDHHHRRRADTLRERSPYFSGVAPQYIFGPTSPDISALCAPVPCLYNPA